MALCVKIIIHSAISLLLVMFLSITLYHIRSCIALFFCVNFKFISLVFPVAMRLSELLILNFGESQKRCPQYVSSFFTFGFCSLKSNRHSKINATLYVTAFSYHAPVKLWLCIIIIVSGAVINFFRNISCSFLYLFFYLFLIVVATANK